MCIHLYREVIECKPNKHQVPDDQGIDQQDGQAVHLNTEVIEYKGNELQVLDDQGMEKQAGQVIIYTQRSQSAKEMSSRYQMTRGWISRLVSLNT